jgi:6-phosphofructokinase 1
MALPLILIQLSSCAAIGTTSNLHLIPKIRSSTLKSILRGGSDDTKPCGESTVTLKNIWTADKPVTLSINVQPMKIDDIASWYPESKPQANPLLENTWPINNNFCSKHETLIETIFVDSKWVNEKGITYHQWVRAGPRREIFFKPSEVVAAIVTCGGLCPGLNNVVREIARTLTDSYGVKQVYGIPFGYRGFYSYPWKNLTIESIDQIHKRGGSVLGSSRGGHDLARIMDSLLEKGVNQVYVIGGDGTHRGANAISQEAARRRIPMAVCGVPKTIDNDIPFIDKSFGFDTAVEEAVKTINCAHVEASDCVDGVAVVKLMGRECGFVAMHATLASNDVDVCLLPEVEFDLDLLMTYVQQRLDRRGHCLIVVAEGAGQEHFVGVDLGTDASGNKKLPDIGHFLKDKVKAWFQGKGRVIQVRYMDPSYQIRSIPASATDSIYCSALGSHVVHGAMAGFTGFSCGQINNRYAYIPIEQMCAPGMKVQVSSSSRQYMRMVRVTGQPSFLPKVLCDEAPINPALAAQAAAPGPGSGPSKRMGFKRTLSAHLNSLELS